MDYLIKDEKLIRTIIIQNAERPFNYVGKLKMKGSIEFNSDSCSDHYYFKIIEDDSILINLEFSGEGCVISKAVTSIAIKELISKNKDEIQKIINKFFEMMETGEVSQELGMLHIFRNISDHPNRKTCATIWAQVLKQEVEKW